MSVVDERPVPQRAGWDTWGTVGLGTTRIPVRLAVFVGGILVWLVAMLVVGGAEAITAIWTNALFLVPLILIGSLVRTVRIRSIAFMGFAGGALMGVMYLLAQFLGPLLGSQGMRAFVMPFLEELLKVLPVLAFLWLGRRTHTWTIGATDVLLLAAASGVGFGVVEDAHIRAHSGWPDQIDWLPVTELISGRLIVGHAIWAALAGATIGLALLLLRARRPALVAVLVGASGFAVAVLDHAANNYGVGASGGFAAFLNFVTAHGWIALTLFFAAVIGCLVADALIVYRRRPDERRYAVPPRAAGFRGLRDAWEFLLDRRALAFARYRWQRAPRRLIEEVGRVAARLEWSLFMRQPEPLRAEIEAALRASTSDPPVQGGMGEQQTTDRPTAEAGGER